MTQTEDELFARFCASGDPAALAALFDRVAPELLAVALHLCGRRADAEDLVQETFLVALERAATWDPTRGVFPWLVGILTRRRHRQRRAEGRTPDHVRLPAPLSEDPADAAQRSELDAAITAAVAALGDVYRPVLHLYLRHGLDAKEIAEALGRPHGSVRTQVVRGLQRLREALPIGIAAALAADLGAGRGLGAVREAVLAGTRLAGASSASAAAGTLAGASTSASATHWMFGIGALMTKQAWLAVGAALLLTTWWYASKLELRGSPSLDPLTAPQPEHVADRSAHATALAPSVAATGDGRTGAAPAAPAPGVSRAGSVTVHVVGLIASLEGGGGEAHAPEERSPLVGVLVELWPGHAEEPLFIGRRRELETDAHGAVRFDGLAPGPYSVDVVERPRDPFAVVQAPRHIELLEGGNERIEVSLPLSVELRGRVVDEVGAPVEGAAVWAGGEVAGAHALPRHLVRRVARAAADGTFRAPLRAHEVRIAARMDGYADSPALAVSVLGSTQVEWKLVLRRELARVRGTARDASNQPIAGLDIALQRRGDSIERREDGLFEQGHLALLVRTDTQGDFAAELTPGIYDCRAVGPSGSATATIQANVAETCFVELVFADAVAVRGTVRGPTGAPVPELPVWIDEVDADGQRRNRLTRTLSDGSFYFFGVPRRPFVVEAGRIGGRLRARSAQPTPVGALVECALVFDDLPPLRGRVVRSSGEAVAGALVRVRSLSDEDLGAAVCEEDGSFELREVPAGRYRVTVSRSLLPDARTLVESEAFLGPDELIVLQVEAERGSLRGRVVDGRGAPLEGIALNLSGGDEQARATLSGADGCFVLEGLPPVQCTLRARGPGRSFVNRAVQIRADGVTEIGDVSVPSEAGFRARILRPDGSPWTEAPPVPWLWRGNHVMAGRDRVEYELLDGEVLVHGLAPGTYFVRAPLGDSLTFTPLTVELQSGLVERVELRMQHGRALTLELEAPPAHSAPDGLELTVRDAAGLVALRSVVPPPAGFSSRWRVEHTFPPGLYSATASGSDGSRWSLDFEVRLEGEQPQLLRVPRQ
ncbi:MAG: sigma-70 family RNA polymerase sigma factor [Planctomycetota bacterium]